MRNARLPFCLMLAGWGLAGCASAPYAYTHKDFAERVNQMHTVEVLPVVRTGILSALSGSDLGQHPFPNEEEIQGGFTEVVTNELGCRGMRVLVAGNPAVACTNWMSNVQERATGFWNVSWTRPDAPALARELHVDGLVFLHVAAYQSTPGRKAKTIFPNTLAVVGALCGDSMAGNLWVPWKGASVQISLVDGKTGDVLWRTAKHLSDFDDPKPPQIMKELFTVYPRYKRLPPVAAPAGPDTRPVPAPQTNAVPVGAAPENLVMAMKQNPDRMVEPK